MKKRTVIFALMITLFIFSTASAEGIWDFFSGLSGPASAPVFREVELPPLEDVALLGVSPTGDYLAFDSEFSYFLYY